LMSTPVVLQYNQCGNQDILSIDRLESLLNPWGLLSFPANSTQGEGIKETLKAILSLTISHLLQNPIAGQPDQTNTAGFDSGPPIQGTSSMPDSLSPVSQGATHEPAAAPPHSRPQQSVGPQPPSPPQQIPASSGPADPVLPNNQPESASGSEIPSPIVIPVSIPRQMFGPNGNAQIILEIKIED